jgi:hypothetical protein
VTCRDMDDVISSQSGTSVLGPLPTQHLVRCARCRSLAHLLDEVKAGDGLRPSESQLRRIETKIVTSLKPVRPLLPSPFYLVACAVIFFSVAAAGTLQLGTNGWQALAVAQRIAVFMTVSASAILWAVSMVRHMVPGSKHAIAPTTLPLTIFAALILMMAATFRWRQESGFIAGGLMCLKNGLTYAIPAAFLLWLTLRRGAILFPKLMGAAAGGLAGLIGLSVLEGNCPNLNVFHILVWHGGVVLISSLGGALVGAAAESIGRSRSQKTPGRSIRNVDG